MIEDPDAEKVPVSQVIVAYLIQRDSIKEWLAQPYLVTSDDEED